MSIEIHIHVRTLLQEGEPIGADTQCVTLKPDQFRRFMSRPELIGVLSHQDMGRVASFCIINAAVSSIIVFYPTIEAHVFEDVKRWRDTEDFGPSLDSLTCGFSTTRPIPNAAHVAQPRGYGARGDLTTGLDITDDQVRKDYWDRKYGIDPETIGAMRVGLTLIEGGRA